MKMVNYRFAYADDVSGIKNDEARVNYPLVKKFMVCDEFKDK